MLKTILIDDEKDAIESLSFLLNDYCKDVEIISTANTVLDGIKSILLHKPELVFLDIDLHNGTGFDILESIPDRKFQVIFVTAFNDYAIKAFKANAIDYLLKPVDIDELINAVEKASKICTSSKLSENNIENLLSYIKPTLAKIAIQTTDNIEYLNPSEIVRVEAEGNYCTIFLISKKKIMVSKSLKELYELLDPNTFMRTHHSQIINSKHVARYCLKDGGHIEMTDGSVAMLSRRKKDEFIEMMNH